MSMNIVSIPYTPQNAYTSFTKKGFSVILVNQGRKASHMSALRKSLCELKKKKLKVPQKLLDLFCSACTPFKIVGMR